MSNIGNVFGNEGWVQSIMDQSRGKTRPGDKRRKAARSDTARRASLLANEPMVAKYGGSISSTPAKQKLGLSGLIRKALKNKQSILDPNARPVMGGTA